MFRAPGLAFVSSLFQPSDVPPSPSQLTSLHINCTDEVFLASGYSKNVGLYDLGTGKRLQVGTIQM